MVKLSTLFAVDDIEDLVFLQDFNLLSGIFTADEEFSARLWMHIDTAGVVIILKIITTVFLVVQIIKNALCFFLFDRVWKIKFFE